jgi:hypothetical protein
LEEKVVYFEEAGAEHTAETLKLAGERAKARGIKKIVIASTRGDTAKQAAEAWSKLGLKMVVVPHQYGFMGGQRFNMELADQLRKQGHAVHFGTMLFHTENLYGNETPRVMANLLRTFCQGMKVCVEIIWMATDGGHVSPGEQVVVVAGTGRGADTAVVAYAAPSTRLLDLHITEVICKPLQTKSIIMPPPGQQMPPPPPPQPGK